MKNLLAFLAAAVLMFVGVGWYLDWFQVLGGPAAAGHYNVNLDFNAKKIEDDVKNGEEKVAGAIDKASKEAAARKAAAGTGDPINNNWADPAKPATGAGRQ